MNHNKPLSKKHQSLDKGINMTDANPAYGEVKNTENTRTVYDSVQ